MRFPLTILFTLVVFIARGQDKIYVSATGNDNNPGSLSRPLQTLAAAIRHALLLNGKDVTIEMRAGTYSLDKTLQINSADLSLHSLTIQPYLKEEVLITGSRAVDLAWEDHEGGIQKAALDLDTPPDALYINGVGLHMARYPDYDSNARVFNGSAADALSDQRVSRWKDPAGGYVHALHQGEWGAFHYAITGKDATGQLVYEGGWQNNRPAPMHEQYRFVENIFEELDAPGEWFYDRRSKTIFVYPPKGINLQKAHITCSYLTDLVHIQGREGKPVKNVTIRSLSFTQTARSFMLAREPLLRSDWAIYRGGAILLDGTENVRIDNCKFYEIGGNAIFVSNYNRKAVLSNNHIHDIGANAIAFVGSPEAVRSPAFRYELFVPWKEMDYTPGPKNNNYPQSCVAEGNLIHHIGTIEKQVAGVEIAMSSHITVRYNTIYSVPRAGINIGDGCWGGHLLEFNDVFNTVLETGDHGAFNSWGRDRFWRPEREMIDSIVAARPGIEMLDVIDPIIIRNNRFHCDHGWDIDLDDGSSNYRIYNNVCLNGGLKLREGYQRVVTNNILINNTFHPHVWLRNSRDIFQHNIVTAAYAPILMDHWGASIDSNFFLSPEALARARELKLDGHGAAGDAGFIDPVHGNYHLQRNSSALKQGFRDFNMEVGVTNVSLKKIAAKPPVQPLFTKLNEVKGIQIEWLGATLKNIESPGERSAAGTHDNKGVLLLQVPANSVAARSGLEKADVIVGMGEEEINSVTNLQKIYQRIKWMGRAEITILRNQALKKLEVLFK